MLTLRLHFYSWGTWTAEKMNRSEGSLWNPVPSHCIMRKVSRSAFYRTVVSYLLCLPFSPSQCIMRKVSRSAFYITMVLYLLCLLFSFQISYMPQVFLLYLPQTSFWPFQMINFQIRVRLSRLGCRWEPLTGLRAEALAVHTCPRPPRCVGRYLLWECLES